MQIASREERFLEIAGVSNDLKFKPFANQERLSKSNKTF